MHATESSVPDGSERRLLQAEDSENEHNMEQPKPYKVYTRRWVILGIFCLCSMSNAFQWIQYGIISNIIVQYYNTSPFVVNWFSILYMLCYIPLIFPATWLLDARGLRFVTILGSGMNAVGACLKLASMGRNLIGVAMAAQTISASAQVFILGIPAHLAAVWFGPREVSTATAIGVFGNQLGIAIGFLLPPVLVPVTEDQEAVQRGLSTMFYGTAAVSICLFLLILFVFQNEPPIPPSPAQAAIKLSQSDDQSYLSSVRTLLSNGSFLLLVITYGINAGCFYSLSTLLNQIILHYFPDAEVDTGWVGLTIVFAGMVGSVLCGLWLDRTKTFKITTLVVYLLTFAGMMTFTFTLDLGRMWVVFLVAGFLGFFMTGYLPLGFEFAAEITYPEPEGTSSGLLNASAQAFGIAFTLGMGVLVDHENIRVSLLVLSGSLLLGTVLTVLIKSDLRRQAAGHAATMLADGPTNM
ncbi:feline leukemia virus subgroup C receptor-related protein 1-like isoform X1 [Branchiostoma floridae]|uniref:Choline/ethanolamine transporter FLVCR1 n=1 Tax=Branchiostoma floridae TaxID=7739 RepID=A0A9J7MXK5_BRAFL|nr:feline leukemia virus subgroup C receptor-related protein 1-like isoform X1 [Branchiostoma floridae]